MTQQKYINLKRSLSKYIDQDRLIDEPLRTLAYGTDASFYRLIPQLVIKSKTIEEVSLILKTCNRASIPVTFRAAGTSLSGQAITDSVLVIAGEHWKKFELLDGNKLVKLGPGWIGGRVNARLAPLRLKIGPDPASINAAMIGGIFSNNASGMCCGTAENSYKTVESVKLILKDGTVLDTGSQASKDDFRNSNGNLLQELEQLATEVQRNKFLSQRIKDKYKMKNTTGYSLNALVDFKDPFDIINHLLVGAEGTLAFVAEVCYKTIVDLPYKASALMIFSNIKSACNAVIALKSAPVAAVELMDRASLHSVEDNQGIPKYIKTLSKNASALLVEAHGESSDDLSKKIDACLKSVDGIKPEVPIKFTDIPEEYALYWKIRKGLFPAVGAIRKTGTTVIIEDITFPVGRLAQGTLDLQQLFEKYDYPEAVIFGHALEGNLHFVFCQDFNDSNAVKKYEIFMEELVRLVVDKYDGALKAEHGTGRNMAPYVQKEWGEEAYKIIKKIKLIFDPDNLINPGVIINPDPKAHLKNFKPLPEAHELIDKCMECGFCEPSCVSHDLTLSPRQRIVVYRRICELQNSGNNPQELEQLIKNNYRYDMDSTCATDGLCALSCPINIDTGKLVKYIRNQNASSKEIEVASNYANHFSSALKKARELLSVAHFAHSVLGTSIMSGVANTISNLAGLPKWSPEIPKNAKKIIPKPVNANNNKQVVYFPSCINRTFGVSKNQSDQRQLTEVLDCLLRKANYEVIYPDGLDEQCCGMPFSSKGFLETGKSKSQALEKKLMKHSENGKYPIISDMSPCLSTMMENMADNDAIKLYEPIHFVLDVLIDDLVFKPIDEKIAIFPVCSMKKMGKDVALEKLAKLCATNVTIIQANCCGTAGDKGFKHPEFVAHGLRNLKKQLHGIKRAYSTSRTCEINFSKISGVLHKSLLYLVDEVTVSKN